MRTPSTLKNSCATAKSVGAIILGLAMLAVSVAKPPLTDGWVSAEGAPRFKPVNLPVPSAADGGDAVGDGRLFDQQRIVPLGSNWPSGKPGELPRSAVICITRKPATAQ